MIRHFQAGDGRASWQARLGDGAGLVGDKTLQRQCEKMETSSPGITGLGAPAVFVFVCVSVFVFVFVSQVWERMGSSNCRNTRTFKRLSGA